MTGAPWIGSWSWYQRCTGERPCSWHRPLTDRTSSFERGMSMTAVAPIWEGVTIIPDEVTKAKSGPNRHNGGDALCHEGSTDRRWPQSSKARITLRGEPAWENMPAFESQGWRLDFQYAAISSWRCPTR